jgi:hypothetical protein
LFDRVEVDGAVVVYVDVCQVEQTEEPVGPVGFDSGGDGLDAGFGGDEPTVGRGDAFVCGLAGFGAGLVGAFFAGCF